MPSDGTTPGQLPPTCEVRDWRVFTNGFHKDTYYPPLEINQIADNFAKLAGHLTPLAALGHDRTKRLTVSLGLPNVGEVTGCRATPEGDLYLTVTNVPTWLGGMINARRYRAGSVELKKGFQDPKDPAKKLDGSVLDAVAFLGDEQPAVKGCDPPTAVFADGTPVPPNYEPMPIPSEVMSSLYSDSPANPAFCFSAMSPIPKETSTMNPDLDAKLAGIPGLTPDIIAAIKAALMPAAAGPTPSPTGDLMADSKLPITAPPAGAKMGDDATGGDDAAMMAACKKFAEDPAATPEQKMMSSMYSSMKKMSDEMTKRQGAVEAKMAADSAKDEEMKMAAFSAEVDAECAKIATKIAPVVIQHTIKPQALAILTTKTFASATDQRKAFTDLFAGLASLPDDKRLTLAIATAKPKGGPNQLTEGLAALIGPGSLLDRQFGTTDMRQRLNIAG